jgi:hypothetical protein
MVRGLGDARVRRATEVSLTEATSSSFGQSNAGVPRKPRRDGRSFARHRPSSLRPSRSCRRPPAIRPARARPCPGRRRTHRARSAVSTKVALWCARARRATGVSLTEAMSSSFGQSTVGVPRKPRRDGRSFARHRPSRLRPSRSCRRPPAIRPALGPCSPGRRRTRRARSAVSTTEPRRRV